MIPQDHSPIRSLAGEALLAAWERGAAEPPPARAVTLLRAGWPEMARQSAAAMPVTARDRAILDLRRRTFGDTLAAFVECVSCGERLEFTLSGDTVAAVLEPAADIESAVEGEDWTLRLRQANTADLAAAAVQTDLDVAIEELLHRCVEAFDEAGERVPLTSLPNAAREAALESLDALHESADTAIALACPGCGETQSVPLDVSAFFWTEVRQAALRLVADVHDLAAAYGWPEGAILAMTASRRRAYLELVRV